MQTALGVFTALAGVAIVVAPWALALVPADPPRSSHPRPRFDVPGAVLSASGLLVLVWAVIESPGRGWTDPG